MSVNMKKMIFSILTIFTTSALLCSNRNDVQGSTQINIVFQKFLYLYCPSQLNLVAQPNMKESNSLQWKAEGSTTVNYANYGESDTCNILVTFSNSYGETSFDERKDTLTAEFSQFSDSSQSVSAGKINLLELSNNGSIILRNIQNGSQETRNLFIEFTSDRTGKEISGPLNGVITLILIAE